MTQPLVGKQILIVEDEPVFRSLMDSWFSSLGATTAVAGDGLEALELLWTLHTRPDDLRSGYAKNERPQTG